MLIKFVKIEDSISGCVREEFVTCKPIDVVSAAIQYEGLDMLNTFLLERVDSLNRKLKKEDITPEEVTGIKKQLEKLEEYQKAIADMAAAKQLLSGSILLKRLLQEKMSMSRMTRTP